MSEQESKETIEKNAVIEALSARKSVRVYEKRPIEESKRHLILQAALQAPTAANMQLYTIIEVVDPALREGLSELCERQTFIKDAPMALLFTADVKKWYDLFHDTDPGCWRPGAGDLILAWEDTYIAAQNVVTAAWALGIGSCYIGHIHQHYEKLRDLFKLPDYVLPAGLLLLGYPTKQQKEREKPRRFCLEDMICRDTYKVKEPEEFSRMVRERQGRDDASYETWIQRYCQVKWNASFRAEMDRSVRQMIKGWLRE